jgi:hypothetical protein
MATSKPVTVKMNLPLTMKAKGPSATSVYLYQFICQQKENKLTAHNYYDSFQDRKVILVSRAIYIFLKHHARNVCETIQFVPVCFPRNFCEIQPLCAGLFSLGNRTSK